MTSKFMPPNRAMSAIVRSGEEEAIEHYQKRLVECNRDLIELPVRKYDFNRGFEYGIQWALDYLEELEKYKNYSHYGCHHPLNYEKLFPLDKGGDA